MLNATRVVGMIAVAVMLGAVRPALGQSGYQTINGTRVYTVIDQAAGIATFSNECGTQQLSQRQLQAGAIPDRIIPCPRPSSPAPRTESAPRDNRQVEEAKAHWREAAALFRDKMYAAAADKFQLSARAYSAGGSPRAAEQARTEVRRCVCYDFATRNWNNAGELRFHSCHEFAEMMKRIADRVEQLTAAAAQPKRDEAKRVVVLVATPSGLFYGTAEGRLGAGTATTEAEAICNQLKANTATTSEERKEECNRSTFISDGCVALARSHDMYWGAPSSRAAGLASAKPAEAAREQALAACRRAGGQNCFVVPESVRCVGGGFRSDLRSQ